MVRSRGFASLPELAGELQVSESTIRRDLEHLEDVGYAKRTHGGVFYTGESPQFPHFKDRQESHWDKKRAIARKAVELIEDGDTLLLDGGSTTYEVAQLLVGRPLQIVTNSMPVANLFASESDSDLVLIGGNIHLRTGVTLGPYANSMLADLNVRHAIISVAAVSERGFYNSNILQVETQRAMLAAGDEVIVVADSTKFGHSSLARLCGLSEIDHVVVDHEIDKSWKTSLTKVGVRVTIAEPTDEAESN
jgi:DeoR/GlpR family transcriptional regulator of sugar metabolism